jgi:hypothetical protein
MRKILLMWLRTLTVLPVLSNCTSSGPAPENTARQNFDFFIPIMLEVGF